MGKHPSHATRLESVSSSLPSSLKVDSMSSPLVQAHMTPLQSYHTQRLTAGNIYCSITLLLLVSLPMRPLAHQDTAGARGGQQRDGGGPRPLSEGTGEAHRQPDCGADTVCWHSERNTTGESLAALYCSLLFDEL